MVDMRNTTTTQTKGETMSSIDNRQTINEGCVVMVAGLEMIATDVRIEKPIDPMTGLEFDDLEDVGAKVTFVGTFTENARNDHVRNTGYNRSRYGGNRLAYIF